MRKEYDFSNAKRANFRNLPPFDQIDRHTKVRITIFIDNDILKFFKARAAKRGKAPYQTQINQALREYMEGSPPPGKGALVADDKLISRLAERIAEYSGAKRKKRARKSKS
ncbi:MAG: hypothetical protein DMD77_17135 [Candidatus Rokuibacteriota bacterium]|nr:MAG: hypothetical protein DMD77_17135 [Candidatus Rokubacteria bacterium]